MDEWEIKVGDSIPKKLQTGLENADFIAVVLSQNSTSSSWVEVEWEAKYWEEVSRRQVLVLPIVIDNCTIPTLLRTKKYADFRSGYEVGLVALVSSIQHRQDSSGIYRYYADFVQITEDWIRLFAQTRRLDLLMMYSATWRNTYLQHIRKMLTTRDGRLRVVVPDIWQEPTLLRLYANRLQISPAELTERVETAISEYVKLTDKGGVEIFATSRYINHACYLFDTGGIVSLYSYKADRTATPAITLHEGDFLNFLRDDFEWLVDIKNEGQRVLDVTSFAL